MTPSQLFAKCLFATALPFTALATAHAAAYTFNVNYFGGDVVTLAAGSDDPTSVTLQAGDTFAYRLIAAGTGEWTSVGGSIFPAFSLYGNFGTGISDFTFNLLQNGSTVFSYFEANANTCCAHLGTNTVALPAAVFDEFELLVSITSTGAAGPAFSLLPYPGRGPENYSPTILAFNPSASVPEPASWALAIAALGLAGATRRRK
ncbi:MAG: PEP-CTERM sorting domain-containing protein [Betaproteobacteria bacterium]|nr:PEP-CTERM sorting domain-containing protein [Betaproteobacteria bacterium]